MLGEADDDLDEAAARHTDNKLRTALPRAALSLRLRETFRQARLSIEEPSARPPHRISASPANASAPASSAVRCHRPAPG